MLSFPLTRKAKTLQQRSIARSSSEDRPLNISQQFPNQHSLSAPGNMQFLHNELVII
jgi:hypothetical protein